MSPELPQQEKGDLGSEGEVSICYYCVPIDIVSIRAGTKIWFIGILSI